MRILDNSEFAKEVLAKENMSTPFVPQVYYDPDVDCVEFITKADDFYAERIDELVTVYYSRKDNELIGSLIKGIASLLKRKPNLNILIKDGRVKLAHIFIARAAMAEDCFNKSEWTVYQNIYQKLIEQAEDAEAEFEMCPA